MASVQHRGEGNSSKQDKTDLIGNSPPSSTLDWKVSGENGRAAEKIGRTEKLEENQGELNKNNSLLIKVNRGGRESMQRENRCTVRQCSRDRGR